MRTGEVLLNAWQLNWFHHALLNDPGAWLDANIFFPYQGATALNDLLLTHALVTLPAAWTESPVLALNLAFLGGVVLCGVWAHQLIVELVDAPWAATVGGTLFALTPETVNPVRPFPCFVLRHHQVIVAAGAGRYCRRRGTVCGAVWAANGRVTGEITDCPLVDPVVGVCRQARCRPG